MSRTAHGLDSIPDNPWHLSAVCRDADPEIFFPTRGHNWNTALATALIYCNACPVTDECLKAALEQGDDWAIRAGTLPSERREMRQRSSSHARTGEPPSHCINGHLYNNANTGYYPDGRRRCLVCSKESYLRSLAKTRADREASNV